MATTSWKYFHQKSNYGIIAKILSQFYGVDLNNKVVRKKDKQGNDIFYSSKTKSQKGKMSLFNFLSEEYFYIFMDLYVNNSLSGKKGEEIFAKYIYWKSLYDSGDTSEIVRNNLIKSIGDLMLNVEEQTHALRQNKLDRNSLTDSSSPVIDKFSYLFIEKKIDPANEKLQQQIQLHLVDAKALLKIDPKNYYLRQVQKESGISYSLNIDKRLPYQDIALERTGNEKLYEEMKKLQLILNYDYFNADNSIINQLAQITYKTADSKDKKIGEARAFDILLHGNNMASVLKTYQDSENNQEGTGIRQAHGVLQGIFDELNIYKKNEKGQFLFDSENKKIVDESIVKKLISENEPGLLTGDAQLKTGQVQNELQIKTQGFGTGTNLFGVVNTSMLESLFYLLDTPSVLFSAMAGYIPIKELVEDNFTKFIINEIEGHGTYENEFYSYAQDQLDATIDNGEFDGF